MAIGSVNVPGASVADLAKIKKIAEEKANSDLSNVESIVLAEAVKKSGFYTCGTEDLTAGTSELETGKLHFVYA